jgi:hypothetical protein
VTEHQGIGIVGSDKSLADPLSAFTAHRVHGILVRR